jgi:AbrB family looped-hinge helix DNA binding protein
MRTTIDKAGRVVVPKQMRDAVGLVPGEVDVEVDGSALRVTPVLGEGIVERDGWLLIDSDLVIGDDEVAMRRRADQR